MINYILSHKQVSELMHLIVIIHSIVIIANIVGKGESFKQLSLSKESKSPRTLTE